MLDRKEQKSMYLNHDGDNFICLLRSGTQPEQILIKPSTNYKSSWQLLHKTPE